MPPASPLINPESSRQIPAPPGSADVRVPVRQKIGYGLGSAVDMWGHWLYPTLAFPVFDIFLAATQVLQSASEEPAGKRTSVRDREQARSYSCLQPS